MPRLKNREINRAACAFSDTLYIFLDGFSRQERARIIDRDARCGQSVSKRTKIIFRLVPFFAERIKNFRPKRTKNLREGEISRENRPKSSFWLCRCDRYLHEYPAQFWKSQSHDSHVGSHMTIKSHLVSKREGGGGEGAWLYERRDRAFFFPFVTKITVPQRVFVPLLYTDHRNLSTDIVNICALSRAPSCVNKRVTRVSISFFACFVFFFIYFIFLFQLCVERKTRVTWITFEFLSHVSSFSYLCRWSNRKID